MIEIFITGLVIGALASAIGVITALLYIYRKMDDEDLNM